MYMNTMLRLFNVDQLVNERVVRALERQEQLDELQAWYDGFSPFPMLHELAEAELKHASKAVLSRKCQIKNILRSDGSGRS